MKYKVGEIVRIKSDLEYGAPYANEDGSTEAVVSEMLHFGGEIAKISEIRNGYYILEDDKGEWYWTDEMLESTEVGPVYLGFCVSFLNK